MRAVSISLLPELPGAQIKLPADIIKYQPGGIDPVSGRLRSPKALMRG
jgi:hypothetical protein